MAAKASTLSEENFPWGKADDSLMNAVGKRDLSRVRSLVNKKKANPTKISPHLGVAAIHQAASFDKADILDALLMFPSIDVDKTDARKRTALHHAVREGRDECVKRLILVNANTALVENKGLSALHLASMLGHLGCLQLLVATVRSVDAKDDEGRTALFYAASRGSASSCRLLLEYGANIDATDNNGRTALMMAAEKGHQAAFQYLLSRDSHVSLRDNQGRDVRWYATNYNHADLLLLLPNGVVRQSLSDTSDEAGERFGLSSPRKLAKKWGPEHDLSSADPQKIPVHQDQLNSSTTNSVAEEDVNARTVTLIEHKSPDKLEGEREQEWTRERLELIRKLEDLAEENEELAQWKDNTEATEQHYHNLLKSQREIYPLMEEVYQSVESFRRQISTKEVDKSEANGSYLQEASQNLTLILQALYETNRANAVSADETRNPLIEELNRRDKVIRDLRNRATEYEKEIERLEIKIRQLNELIEGHQTRIQTQDEQLGQLQQRLRDQTVSLRNLSAVKEVLSQVTELDDVNEDQAAAVIREIAEEYQKLQTKYQELKAKKPALKTASSSELHLNSPATHETVADCHSIDNGADWSSKTLQDLRAMRDRSDTPISDLLRQQLIVLRNSLECQIEAVRRSDNFDDKKGSWLLNSVLRDTPIEHFVSYTNSMQETAERGRESQKDKAKEEVMSRSRCAFKEPELRSSYIESNSGSHSLHEDERLRYETEIRKLCREIDLLKMEDSGVRTISTDAEAEDERSQMLLMLGRQIQSPVSDESVGLLTENRRLKSELERLRSTITLKKSATCRTDQQVSADSKEIQTDAELLKKVMLSRMVSDYEKELLEKVESLKSQNSMLRSEIESLSVERKREEKNAPRMRSENVGGSGTGRDAPQSTTVRNLERGDSARRRAHEESDLSGESSFNSVYMKERSFHGSIPGVPGNVKKTKKRKAENGGEQGTRDARSSVSSLSQTSGSSDEENYGRTRQGRDREGLTKRTSKKTSSGTRNKEVLTKKAASLSTDDEMSIHENRSHNASSKPLNVNLPGRTADGALKDSAEITQKTVVQELSRLPGSNKSTLHPRGSSVALFDGIPDCVIPQDTILEDASVTRSSCPTQSSRPDYLAAGLAHEKELSPDEEKAKTTSTAQSGVSIKPGNYEDEVFECMFQANQDVIDPIETVQSKSISQANSKTKIKLLHFDAQTSLKLRSDLEAVTRENARLREEMSGLKAEISSLRKATPKSLESVNRLEPAASTGAEGVSKAQPVTSNGVAFGTPVTSKQQSIGHPSTPTGVGIGPPGTPRVEGANSRHLVASEEETKSQDEGYRFLSEDENGTLKFKEFSLETSNHFGLEEDEAFGRTAGSSDDDVCHSPSASTSRSTSPNTTDEDENDIKKRHPDGQRRKREEAKEGKRKRKHSNEMQQRGLNETVTLVVNQAEPSGKWHQPPYQYLHHQHQQHSSRKAAQPCARNGDDPEASNPLKGRKEILAINGETLTDADKTKIYSLQKQLQETEEFYNAIVGTYRSHLLASIQGCLDSEVANALCRIVTLQNGRLLEY